jgi:hypothetical protein
MMKRWINGALVPALLAAPMIAWPADANAPPLPDDEFLEYLGSWDGDDADWLVAKGPDADGASSPARGDRGTKDGNREGAQVPSQEQSR